MKLIKQYYLIIFITSILLNIGWSSGFERELTISEEDLQLSKTKSLISGIEFDENAEFKQKPPMPILAVLTLGFSKLDRSHAYVVFERPQKTEDGKTKILLTGLHFCPDQSHINQGDYLGPVYGNGRSRIIRESDMTVLSKFVRCYEKKDDINEFGYTVSTYKSIEPRYSKFRTFIIKNEDASKALQAIEQVQDRIEFSLAGWSINSFRQKISHNCCTFAAYVLQCAGIDLRFSDNKSWRRDQVWLQDISSQYEQRMLKTNSWKYNSKNLENFIYDTKIFTPPSAEQILESV